MSQEEIWKIEKPLNSSKAKGLGLGLPIVKSIIEAHGGKITFRPNIPKGLIVEIQIPCLGRRKEKNEEAGTTADKIVDDDDDLRNALSFLLKAQGWRVAAYSSAKDFLVRTLRPFPAV